MIKIENVEVVGWEPAIRGMRNPMNSWDKSDSYTCYDTAVIGENDLRLANSLSKGGPVHAKYRRMIVVYLDITAPLYWWKEFDTYAVGTVKNSCSTMHKIHAKEFVWEDFSYEDVKDVVEYKESEISNFRFNIVPKQTIEALNIARLKYLETNDKRFWRIMIQLLPSSYNQRRTVMLNYEVLDNIRRHRANHKLDEWREFCAWTDTLPYINDICPMNGADLDGDLVRE